MKTKRELQKRFSPSGSQIYHDVTIPKGARVVSCGDYTGQYFVDDLSFIDRKSDPFLFHDATYYGIRVESDEVE